MERDDDFDQSVIELGTASTDTQGPLGDMIEPDGLWYKHGISDE
jgi:hypothetical protein